MNTRWYEVWADEGHDVPYLLLMRPCESGFEILDPKEANGKVFEATTYDEARLWLLEDEFSRVGRKEGAGRALMTMKLHALRGRAGRLLPALRAGAGRFGRQQVLSFCRRKMAERFGRIGLEACASKR
jgi:hypothetical protein